MTTKPLSEDDLCMIDHAHFESVTKTEVLCGVEVIKTKRLKELFAEYVTKMEIFASALDADEADTIHTCIDILKEDFAPLIRKDDEVKK